MKKFSQNRVPHFLRQAQKVTGMEPLRVDLKGIDHEEWGTIRKRYHFLKSPGHLNRSSHPVNGELQRNGNGRRTVRCVQ
jgi:hypothetical protein